MSTGSGGTGFTTGMWAEILGRDPAAGAPNPSAPGWDPNESQIQPSEPASQSSSQPAIQPFATGALYGAGTQPGHTATAARVGNYYGAPLPSSAVAQLCRAAARCRARATLSSHTHACARSPTSPARPEQRLGADAVHSWHASRQQQPARKPEFGWRLAGNVRHCRSCPPAIWNCPVAFLPRS